MKSGNNGSWRAVFAGILALGVLARLPLLGLPLTYASDVWRQADTASIAYHFLHNGFRLFFPQVFWGGAGPGYVESEFQLYPFVTSVLYLVHGEHLWIGQVVSLLFSLGTWMVFARIARRMLGPQASVAALLLFVFSPLAVRYSVAFMPEATVLFFTVAALAAFLLFQDSGRVWHLWLAAAMMALAFLVKPTSIHLLLVFGLLVVAQKGIAGLKSGVLWLAGIACLVPGVIWFAHARTLYLTYGNTFGLMSGGDSKFATFAALVRPDFYRDLLQLDTVWIFAGLPVLLFAAGLWRAIRTGRPPVVFIGTLTILLYYMIVGRYSRQEWGLQYHVFFLPYAALGVGAGLEYFRERLRNSAAKRFLILLLAGGTVAYGAYWYRTMVVSPGHGPADAMVEFAGVVAAHTLPEDRLIVTTGSSSMDGAVANNYQEPVIFFYARRYGWSLPADLRTPARVRELQEQGARYFVAHQRGVVQGDSLLTEYLRIHGEKIELPESASGEIYRLR